MTMVFAPFPKIHRLAKAMDCVITEKIDGTNAAIFIDVDEHGTTIQASRWIHVT